ncbi:hypothetical protein N7527_005931, partial [Penicillium freii]
DHFLKVCVASSSNSFRSFKLKFKTFSVTLGARAEQNPFSTKLAAIAYVLKIVVGIKDYKITLLTSNKTAAFTLRNPRRQSSQEFIPTTEDNKLLGLAKEQARTATQEDTLPQERVPRIKSTTLNIARSQAVPNNKLRENVGRHAKRKEATVLAQLRTGIARLNRYLNQINVAETDKYDCGQARETDKYNCGQARETTAHRTEILQYTQTYQGNISFFLGGKQPSDNQKWTPNLEAVRASIRFAITTGRLEAT